MPAFALASARYVSGMPNVESHTAAAGLGQSGSRYHTRSMSHAVAQIGIERGPASEVISKLVCSDLSQDSYTWKSNRQRQQTNQKE